MVGWTGFSKTLRGRLGIFFIIVAVIPLLVLSLIGLNQFSSTITDEIEANYETQSREKLNTLEMLISEGRTTISTVAGTPSLRNLAENSATQAESMGLTTMSVEEREAFTGDNSWTVAGASGVAAFLQERVEASGGMFAELFMTDKYGHTVAASKNTSDFVQSDEEWWQEAFGKGQYIGDIEFDDSAGTYALRMATAITDDEGNPIGVVSGAYDFKKFVSSIEEAVSWSQGSNALLINEKGIILADTKDGRVSENIEDLQIPFVEEAVNSGKVYGSSVNEDGRGTEYLFGFAKKPAVSGFEGLNWTLVLFIPSDLVLAPVADMRQLVILITIVFALAAAVVGYIVLGRISKPVAVLAEDTVRISQGDLTHISGNVLRGDDEVSMLTRSFAEMVESIRDIVIRAAKTAGEVVGSASQLSATAEENSSAAEEIAVTVQEMSAEADKQSSSVSDVLEQINSRSDFIKQLVSIAESVSESANEVMSKAESGNKSIATAVRQMHAIKNVVENSAKEVFDLGERSNQIGQITNTITVIAEQTNLLALNAAIEAARAGEQGRGFAVVAEEVRKLAEQASDAASEISGLIKEIQRETDEAVEAIQAGTHEVKTGMQVMGEAGKAFQGVRRAVRHISQRAEESAQAAHELDEGSKAITDAMESVALFAREVASRTESVASVTEEQAASMEEITSAVQNLSEMAEELQRALAHFTVTVDGEVMETLETYQGEEYPEGPQERPLGTEFPPAPDIQEKSSEG